MPPDRNTLINDFLSDADWGIASRSNIAGDASMRQYMRLKKPSGETTVLMDAPPNSNPSIRPFTEIARYLLNIGLSSPQIYAEDNDNGFLLMEDLGDDLFASLAQNTPVLEPDLYRAAVDVLITLHQAEPPDLVHFGPELMAQQASLVFDAWVPVSQDTAHISTSLQTLLEEKTNATPVTILRDYHAENLLWLPERTGVAKVGLLDFQDAMLAHPAYDLVSLLQDVRRDVPARLEQEMLTYYITQTGQDDATFRDAYAVLGVQRNLRILAVFARLARSLGKPQYAQLIPRTWGHITRGLAHPALVSVTKTLKDILPPPTQTNLQKLVQNDL